jgi:hypothetical protein
MTLIARAALAFSLAFLSSLPAVSQTGPSDPQVIAGASTAKINVAQKKLAGHAIATVRVGEDGRVREVLITEVTTEPGIEPQLVKVLQSARFRPAIDASGRTVEASVEMKIELRSSTGNGPKPVAAKADPQLNDKEKARIKKMRCADFLWEWDLIREEAGDGTATEFMPRIATMMYATMRNDAGEYVDVKVWKAAPKGLREAVDQCRDNPGTPFWDGIFKSVMDEAVPR